MGQRSSRSTENEESESITHSTDVAVKRTKERRPVDVAAVGSLVGLALAYLTKLRETGDPAMVAEAMEAMQTAVRLTPDGSPEFPARLTNLGEIFAERFKVSGDLGDISQSISISQRALSLAIDGDPLIPKILLNLRLCFCQRFKVTADLKDLSEEILFTRRAFPSMEVGHANMPANLNRFGVALLRRFQLVGDPVDLEEAITVLRRAVEHTPDGHPYAYERLSNLGTALETRFERFGDAADLAESIAVQQKAVQTCSEEGDKMGSLLSNLGGAFACRFVLKSALGDIFEAVSIHKRALTLTPKGSSFLPSVLTNLGDIVRPSFRRHGKSHEEAVRLTPEGHFRLPRFLHNLGNAYSRRFQGSHVPSDIGQAVISLERSVQLTPEGDGDLPGRLHSLGVSLALRFDLSGNLRDLSEAVSSLLQSVNCTPEGHARLPLFLINLSDFLWQRFELDYNPEDCENSISSVKRASHCKSGSPRLRLKAARTCARLSKLSRAELIKVVSGDLGFTVFNPHRPESTEILSAFATCMGLIALIAGLEQTVQDRYTQLRDVSGLALEAASTACAFSETEKALEWLEQGRCLVWSQLSNLRSPLDDLRTENTELAQQVETLSKELEHAGSSSRTLSEGTSLSEKVSLEGEAHAHIRLARRWDDLIGIVRALPGFESFLQPSSYSRLRQNLPDSGPIVVINVDSARCDAIALVAGLDKPIHIALLDFSLEKADKYRSDLQDHLKTEGFRMRGTDSERGVRAHRPNREEVVCRVLRGLWTEVVKPILDVLGFSRVEDSPGKQYPRIWWCPTGALSFLPIHAAGIYRGPHCECALDYVVSSYTPTITALTDRVESCRRTDGNASGLFLTSQPNAPAASSIPGTTAEVQSIHVKLAGTGMNVALFEGGDITVDDCLKHMGDYSCIHLACHATQNAADPLRSRFLFHKGTLDLATIIQKDLKNADLAFLSACQTSAGEEKLSDEAVHLAAGMLAAGYRRVVSTMWAIGDKHAPDVASDFYEYLLNHEEEGHRGGLDGSRSAHALHHSIQRLRLRLDNSEKSLLTWIPYVHFGY